MPDDYVKRSDVHKAFQPKYAPAINRTFAAMIDSVPAADVKPVKRGEWIGYPECLKYPNAYADTHIVCSVCEECFSMLDNDTERFDFCPHCGAVMSGGQDGTA